MKTTSTVLLFLLTTSVSAQGLEDIDADNNGLIEINYLEDVYAIRYQLDGSGYRANATAKKITNGCADGGCKGYELARDLDFSDDASYRDLSNKAKWTSGSGWTPIGTNTAPFNSIFVGNIYTISKLTISRSTDRIGLFGATSEGAKIINVALSNVNIKGGNQTGGLVGWNRGSIINSYAAGTVSGNQTIGGLVGYSTTGTTIINSYAAGTVSGNQKIGGLAGELVRSTITNGYTASAVLGTTNVGGLVGKLKGSTIINSYAAGTVSGNANVGGLVGNYDLLGQSIAETIVHSHWDVITSRRSDKGGTGARTAALQSAFSQNRWPKQLYYKWSTEAWDFGNTNQYPALKYTAGSGTPACRATTDTGNTDLPVCSELLTQLTRHGLNQLRLVKGMLSPEFNLHEPSYTGTVVNDKPSAQFILSAINPRASIYINYGGNKEKIASGGTSAAIQLDIKSKTQITIEIVSGGTTTQTTTYTLNLGYHYDIDKDNDGLIEIRDLEGLDAIRYQLDGSGYRPKADAVKITAGCPNSGCKGYELTRNLDFNDAKSYRDLSNKAKWTNGDGWKPIGDNDNPFTGIFAGNGYTISNLMINRSTGQTGLFGDADLGAKIINVGLLNVDVRGGNDTAGLVGEIRKASVTNSYVTGTVSGGNIVGGLAGVLGGTITNSYVTGTVSGSEVVGGLVAKLESGTITNSYATGTVSGSEVVGGLVGELKGSTIINSYASGKVSGNQAGGLVARLESSTITNSYWDIQTSGKGSLGGTGARTAALQSAFSQNRWPKQLYYKWSTEAWDFGNTNQYPALKYTAGSGTPACRATNDTGNTELPVCGELLSKNSYYGLSLLQLVKGGLSPEFIPYELSYTGTAFDSTSLVQFILTAANLQAKIYISSGGNKEEITSGKSNEIQLDTDAKTEITIEVVNGGSLPTITYTLILGYLDVDEDNDGLIEIRDLEGLNAVRRHLDGSGLQRSTSRLTTGCPTTGCNGYELARSLDFLDDASYSSTANKTLWTVDDYNDSTDTGWQPIGDKDNPFTAIFAGNGHTISNLMINSSFEHVGLFGIIGASARITRVALLNIDVRGMVDVGGLVGENNGSITNSYARGSVRGSLTRGFNTAGGLVGWNQGSITNSYASSRVLGSARMGGLVGNNTGSITNSYATGAVMGDLILFTTAGGLVGNNTGSITNSYATGTVSGNTVGMNSNRGGLVGIDLEGTIINSYAIGAVSGDRGGDNFLHHLSRGTIMNSYWRKTPHRRTSAGTGSTGLTADQMQSPTGPGMTSSDAYYNWSVDNWDFGNMSQYPVLKYTAGSGTPACRSTGDTGNTELPVCGELLTPAIRYGLTQLRLVEGYLSPEFEPHEISYTGTAVSNIPSIRFIPISVSSRASIYIIKGESKEKLASGVTSSAVGLDRNGRTQIIIEVENGGETTRTIVYTLNLSYQYGDVDVDEDNDGLIEIRDLEGLNAIRYQMDGSGYRSGIYATKITAGCPADECMGYELVRNLDFLDDASYTSTANKIEWTVDDYEDDDDTGWQPIGVRGIPFSGIFAGNSHTISNLMINRSTNFISLFGAISSGVRITDVGLLNIDIKGGDYTSGLVGENFLATITNSYVTGSVQGNEVVGGLIAWHRGGHITNSYTTTAVSGSRRVGGLIGVNEAGNITNAYTRGTVSGSSDSIGGLVGVMQGGTITNNYATGAVSGSRRVGGLIGAHSGNPITNSYWNRTTTGQATSAGGGTSLTTVQMQMPQVPGATSSDAYYNWSTNDWDFGTIRQYPVLKYSDSNTLLPGQRLLADLMVIPTAGETIELSPDLYQHILLLDVSASTMTIIATATTATTMIILDGMVVPSAKGLDFGLELFSTRTITIKAISKYGDERSYTIVANRDTSLVTARLADLHLSPNIMLEPNFAPTITEYLVTIPKGDNTANIRVTPVAVYSQITVNGKVVQSGEMSEAIALVEGATTTITIIVTSQEPRTTAYTIAVVRPPSSDASLRSLKLSTGSLVPDFAPNKENYTADIVDTESITVTAEATHAHATIKVNNKPVISKQPSQLMILNSGKPTMIPVVVTAQDGISSETYTILATRLGTIKLDIKVFLEGLIKKE